MFEEFEDFLHGESAEVPETEEAEQPEEEDLSSDVFHVEGDDPENIRIVGGVPEQWAQTLDSVQGDNELGMGEDCGLVSVSNIERMAGIPEASEDSVCVDALRTGNCTFLPYDIGESGGTTFSQQVELLSMQGIPATAFSHSELSDYGKIAELVEDGLGVILEHYNLLSVDTREMNYSWEQTAEAFPELADALEKGAVYTISDGGVDIQTAEGGSQHLSHEAFAILSPESAEKYIPGGIMTVSSEGTEVQLGREALEQMVETDEYGRIYANHAAVLTGTEYDADGNLLGFDICDSAQGGRVFVSLENMDACYKNVCNAGLVVTDNPIHHNGTPLGQTA